MTLEQDIAVLARYVEIKEAQFEVTSIEIAKLLLAASSMFEIAAKQLCELLSEERGAIPAGKRSNRNINYIKKVISEAYPSLWTVGVEIIRFGIRIRPFEKWHSGNERLSWWNSYTQLKHADFGKAKLLPALEASAAFMIVTLAIHQIRSGKMECEIEPAPMLMEPDWHSCARPDGIGWVFSLPHLNRTETKL